VIAKITDGSVEAEVPPGPSLDGVGGGGGRPVGFVEWAELSCSLDWEEASDGSLRRRDRPEKVAAPDVLTKSALRLTFERAEEGPEELALALLPNSERALG
jgi:hypothetical protein